MKKNKNIFVFDVCGTLTDNNNTYDFIFFVCRKNIFKYILFCFYSFLLDASVFLKIKTDFFRYKIISLLQGYSKNELKSYSFELNILKDFSLKIILTLNY